MSDTEKQINSVEKDPVQDMLEALKKNQKAIYGLVGALIVAFGAYSGMKSYQHSVELEAQANLFTIEKQLEKTERALKEKQVKKGDIKFDESYQAHAASLESFIKQNSNRKAGIRASLMLSRLYSEYDKNDKALEVMALVDPPLKADMLNILFHTQRMTRLIDNAKYDDAIKLADKILGLKEISFTHAMAKLKKAVAVEAKGEIAEAKALYKQVSDDYPEHPAGKTAKQYLRIAN